MSGLSLGNTAIGFQSDGSAWSGKIAAEDAAIHPFFNPVKFQADLVNLAEAERLDRSIISGGSSGIRCWATYYDSNDEVLHIKVSYKTAASVPEYTGIRLKQEHEFQVKAWTGYADQNEAEGRNVLLYYGDRDCVSYRLSVLLSSAIRSVCSGSVSRRSQE